MKARVCQLQAGCDCFVLSIKYQELVKILTCSDAADLCSDWPPSVSLCAWLAAGAAAGLLSLALPSAWPLYEGLRALPSTPTLPGSRAAMLA